MNECEWSGQFVTWILVIGGWLIVNYQQNQRETRKEIHHDLTLTLDRVETIEKLSIEYHTNVHNEDIARSVKLHLQRLWSECDSLSILGSDSLSNLLCELRKSITLKNFDARDHAKLSKDDELIAEISSRIVSLENALKRGYKEKYHSP